MCSFAFEFVKMEISPPNMGWHICVCMCLSEIKMHREYNIFVIKLNVCKFLFSFVILSPALARDCRRKENEINFMILRIWLFVVYENETQNWMKFVIIYKLLTWNSFNAFEVRHCSNLWDF